MIIGFTGSRVGGSPKQWANYDHIFAKLVAQGAHTFVHGCCIGADTAAAARAREAGLHIIGRPGPYGQFRSPEIYDEMMPVEPFLKRNRRIVETVDVMLAIPSTGTEAAFSRQCHLPGGTWYTIEFARRRNRPLHIFFPDGRVRSELTSPTRAAA